MINNTTAWSTRVWIFINFIKYLSICLFINRSIYLSIYPLLYQSIYHSICLSVAKMKIPRLKKNENKKKNPEMKTQIKWRKQNSRNKKKIYDGNSEILKYSSFRDSNETSKFSLVLRSGLNTFSAISFTLSPTSLFFPDFKARWCPSLLILSTSCDAE